MAFIPAKRNLRNFLLLAAVSLPLSGCLLPPLVSIAAIAFDAGSFAATGKTAKDHGISLVAQEDCALLRVLDGDVCRPYSDYEDATLLAALEPLGPVNENWADASNGVQPVIASGPLRGLDYVESASAAPDQVVKASFFRGDFDRRSPQLGPQTASLPLGDGNQLFLGRYLSDNVGLTY